MPSRTKEHSICVALRLAPVLLLVSGSPAMCRAQDAKSNLPPSAPTSAISPSQLPSANPPVPSSSQGRADISWDGNTLQVIAADVGLNRLLRSIATKTNLRITGTAPEEKIFGTYGPGKLEDVLSDLLDGLQVNVMYVDTLGDQAKQLILTARTGGPSLPSAASQAFDSDAQQSPPPQSNVSQRPPQFPPASPPPDSSSPSGEPSTGVRTPQQIFEQLQRLRQQANSPK